MINRKLLLSDLQKQLRNLEKDLREQAEPVDEVPLRLRGEYGHAFEVGRTAGTWAAWRGERVTQVAAPGCFDAWVAAGPNWAAALTKGRRPDAGVGTTGNDGCQSGEGIPRDH